jgi:hypothetical protein
MANETTAQRWATRVAEWRASGLTARAFSTGRDFSPGGLRHWAHLLKKRGAALPSSSPVRLVRVEPTPASGSGAAPPPRPAVLTIEVGNARLEVPAGFDAPTLRTVLQVLGAPASRGAR